MPPFFGCLLTRDSYYEKKCIFSWAEKTFFLEFVFCVESTQLREKTRFRKFRGGSDFLGGQVGGRRLVSEVLYEALAFFFVGNSG